MSDATRVAIVGLGAIGGSVALKLLDRGAIPTGFSAEANDARLAAAAGIRVSTSIEGAVRDVDLILLTSPIGGMIDDARRAAAAALPTATILHASSLQRPGALGFDQVIAARVIGTHPAVDVRDTGFASAHPNLFAGATVFVEPRGTARMREDAELFWSMAGAARIQYLSAEDHDERMAPGLAVGSEARR